jgi:hypothetical protein
MSGPAALKAVQGSNPTDYRRKTGFSFTNKTYTRFEHYEETDSEILLYLKSKTLPSRYYKEGSTVNKRSKYKTSSTYFNPKVYNGWRELLPIKNNKNIRQKTKPSRWILCDKKALPKSRNRNIIHIRPQEKHELLRQQPTR